MAPARPRAAAIRYEAGEDVAPKVIAKGEGLVAERIVAIAREHDIPIHHDPTVVRALLDVELDQHIPGELYLAVAQVLAFLYRLR